MITKIIDIVGVGKFTDFHAGASSFPENLSKIVAVYADNGSGKTTFTQILKSLKSHRSGIVTSRKSFGSHVNDIKIKINTSLGLKTFKSQTWQISPLDIEVFDASYLENNIYVFNPGASDSEAHLFDLVLGEESVKLLEQRDMLLEEKRKAKNHYSSLSKRRRIAKNSDIAVNLTKRMETASIRKADINGKIAAIEDKLNEIASKFGDAFITHINSVLASVAPELKVLKLEKKAGIFVYELQINGFVIKNKDRNAASLRRSLSEGEKNAIAFSFFVASLLVKPDLSNTIVVFDDPISSLDYKRRNATKLRLVAIARKAAQFFLLSHDISFVRDFTDMFPASEILNLKIEFDGKTAYFKRHDIFTDTLRGVFKDLSAIKDFIDNGDKSMYAPRDVIRRLRPILETFLKIKYFGIIPNGKWLGDMLSMIRDSSSDSPLADQKKNYDEIAEINDYTSSYHHGESISYTSEINSEELRNYCRRTLSLIRNI